MHAGTCLASVDFKLAHVRSQSSCICLEAAEALPVDQVGAGCVCCWWHATGAVLSNMIEVCAWRRGCYTWVINWRGAATCVVMSIAPGTRRYSSGGQGTVRRGVQSSHTPAREGAAPRCIVMAGSDVN